MPKKIGSKDNIDVIRCIVELDDKEDGTKTFTATTKSCQSCIIVKWPGGKLQELCNSISCDDMLVLSKSLSTAQ